MDTKKLRRLASQLIALCDEEDYKRSGNLFAGVEAKISENKNEITEAEAEDQPVVRFADVILKPDSDTIVRTIDEPAEPKPVYVQMGDSAWDKETGRTVRIIDEKSSEPKYRHVGKKMQEDGMVRLTNRIGKKEGFCRRESIEKTLVRTTGRTPEDVREAVNDVVQRMHLTCFFWHKYRFYRTIDRQHLMDAATDKLRQSA